MTWLWHSVQATGIDALSSILDPNLSASSDDTDSRRRRGRPRQLNHASCRSVSRRTTPPRSLDWCGMTYPHIWGAFTVMRNCASRAPAFRAFCSVSARPASKPSRDAQRLEAFGLGRGNRRCLARSVAANPGTADHRPDRQHPPYDPCGHRLAPPPMSPGRQKEKSHPRCRPNDAFRMHFRVPFAGRGLRARH